MPGYYGLSLEGEDWKFWVIAQAWEKENFSFADIGFHCYYSKERREDGTEFFKFLLQQQDARGSNDDHCIISKAGDMRKL